MPDEETIEEAPVEEPVEGDPVELTPEAAEQLADVEEEAPVIETVPAEEYPTIDVVDGEELLDEPLPEGAELVETPGDDPDLEDAEGEGPEYGELENMLIVCEQCGRSTLVLAGDKLPELCMCGLLYDYTNESVTTEIQIAEPMILSVRKVPRKFIPRY